MQYLGVEYSVKHMPELDPDFIPFGVWLEAYARGAEKPLTIALERDQGKISVRCLLYTSGRGPHDAHHRPPPFDHPQRLAHSGRGGRPHLRAGHARGAYAPRRPVCDPAQHAGPQQRGMTPANAQKIPDKM